MPENTPSSLRRATGIATALASPALLISPLALAQQGSESATQLAPIQVKAAQERSYNIQNSASEKFTAPLLDTAKSVQIIPQAVIRDQAATS